MLQCDLSQPSISQPISMDKLFPSDAVINVQTAYSAKGDGVTDDTQAILQAIRENVGANKTLYFPTGTYLVSDRLDWRDSNGNWKARLTLQGQNSATTIIKLQNNAPGYTDPNQPKAVIFTASQDPADPAIGSGAEAFDNSLYDLTVDSGVGNSGAIAIDYLANNKGTIRDVNIRSGDGQGYVGLALLRYGPGPCLIKNVGINGFNYGISAQNGEYGITFEYITLANQKISGIRNDSNVLSIRRLTSTNSVPVIQNVSPNGLVTLIDGSFKGGSSSVNAIQNQGGLYARNIVTSGYQSAIQQNGSVVPGANHTEFVSQSSLTQFASSQNALNLPVQEAPTFHDNNFSNWASVQAFGAIPDDYGDDTAAIQAAMDSGKSTIYFPSGTYLLTNTIRVRGQVRRILGMQSGIDISLNTAFGDPANPKPMFRFESGTNNVVIIERIDFFHWTSDYSFAGGICIEHASPQTLVLRDIDMMTDPKYAYHNTAGAGTLFIENVATNAAFNFEYPQDVWARQLNPESPRVNNGPIMSKNGGLFWILGLKTEGGRTVIQTTGGGQTELLGGLLYPVEQVSTDIAAFVETESESSLIYAVSAYAADRNYAIQVKETTGGVTKTLATSNVPNRGGSGSLVPLYVGYTGGAGLKGNYYDNMNFTNLKMTHIDATVNFNWGMSSPAPSMQPTTFSVRWTGQVQPLSSETYTFYTSSDDGVRLWVNGQQIVNNWTDHTLTENSGTITLTAGQKYNIKMEYYQNVATAVAQLWWSTPSIPKQIIPQSQLYAPSPA